MSSRESERRRIRSAYGRYRDDERKRKAWDPHNPGNRAMVGERLERARRLLRAASLHPLDGRDVLEVGCGAGVELARVAAEMGTPRSLVGIDLLPERLPDSSSRRRTPPCGFACADGTALPFRDASFDLVLMLTVVSSLADRGMAADLASEAVRVLRPGGGVLWYDLRRDNPFNAAVRGVPAREVHRLFQGCHGSLETATLLPPLARRLGPAAGLLYPWLVRLPLLRTHLVGLFRKPSPVDVEEEAG